MPAAAVDESTAPQATPRDGTAPWALVALAGLGIGVVLVALTYGFVLAQAPIRMVRESAGLIEASSIWSFLADLPWPVPTDAPVIAATLLVTGVVGIGAWSLAMVVVWDRPATRRALAVILVPAAIALSASAFALPTLSSDLIDYVLSGRVAAVHGANPYVAVPDDFPDDPLLPYASGNYTDDPEAKPPIWIAGAIAAAALSAGSGPADSVLIARLLFLGVTVLNAGLIAAILHRWRPRHLMAGLVMYTWSPVVLFHGQAKFDSLMATFALLAALALVQARPLMSMAALWASVLVKLLTLPLVAVSGLGALVSRRWDRVVAYGLIAIVLTVVAYLPLGGPLLFIEHLTQVSRGGESLPGPVTLMLLVAAGVAVLWAGIRSRGETEGTLQGWAVAALATVLLSPIGSAWYLLVPTAVVSLSGERARTFALIGLSGIALLTDTWMRTSNRDFPLPVPFDLTRTQAFALGMVAVAVVAVVLASLRVRRYRQARSLAQIAEGTTAEGTRSA